jgi:hypothetical protein
MSADLEVVKEIVKELVKVQQKPVHIAKLSQLYRFKVRPSLVMHFLNLLVHCNPNTC